MFLQLFQFTVDFIGPIDFIFHHDCYCFESGKQHGASNGEEQPSLYFLTSEKNEDGKRACSKRKANLLDKHEIVSSACDTAVPITQ